MKKAYLKNYLLSKRKIARLASAVVSCLFVTSAIGQYSGTYTVGGASPDFATIQDAANALASQGVNGPVVLNIRDGIYTENVVQNPIAGVSATNTVTYQSEGLDNSQVSLAAVSGVVFSADSADYLRFNELAFTSSSGLDVIRLHDVSSLHVSNCDIDGVNGSERAIYVDSMDIDIVDYQLTSNTIDASYGLHFAKAKNIANLAFSQNVLTTQNGAVYGAVTGSLNNLSSDQDSITSISGGGVVLDVAGDILSSSITNFYGNTDGNVLNLDAQYNNSNVTLNNLDITSGNGAGVYVRGYNGKIEDVNMMNLLITSSGYGIEINSDELVKNVDLSYAQVTASNSGGVYIRGYYTGVKDVDTRYSVIDGFGTGMRITSDFIVEDVVFIADSIIGDDEADGVYIDADQKIENITVDSCYMFASDSTNGGYGMECYNSDYILNDLSFTNSSFIGYGGLDLEGNTYSNNVTIDKCYIYGANSDGLNTYFDDNVAENWDIRNSTFYSGDGTGLDLYGSDAHFNNMHIFNCDVWAMYDAVNVDSDGFVRNCSVKNTTATSYDGYAIDIETYDGALENFVMDSVEAVRIMPGRVAEVESNYLVGDSISITNSSFICNTINDDTYGEALDLEADYGDWLNVWVNNCVFRAYDGLKIEADYGGSHNTWIENNEIYAHNRGLYVDGVGTDFHFQNNTIMPDEDTLYTGIEVRGYEGISEGFYIENNTITGGENYGIRLRRGQNYHIQNNIVNATDSTGNAIMFHAQDVTEYMNINANQFYGDSVAMGMQVTSSNFVIKDAMLSNNFVSGANVGLSLNNSSQIDVIHNSTSSQANVVNVNLTDINGVDIYNNIFSVNNGGAGDMYNVTNVSNTNIDYNVFEFDSVAGAFSTGDYVSNGLAQWRVMSGYDMNSINAVPAYINDTTDLHLICSTPSPALGMAIANVSADIDGNLRGSSPVIGADEIVATNGLFLEDTVWMCGGSVVLDAGTSSGTVVYLWSTTETTRFIEVSDIGTYSVTMTDDCGTYTDEVVVALSSNTVASTDMTPSFLTYAFANTSVNATSYAWDFGDGNTSTDENPVHVYATPGTYTVELIAFGPCENDTLTFDVTPSVVGLDEVGLNGAVGIYPNPNEGVFNVQFSDVEASVVELSVVDPMGKVLHAEEITKGSPNYIHTIDLTAVPEGVYLVNMIFDNSYKTTLRMIKKIS